VKFAFDAIEPTLKQMSSLRNGDQFEANAMRLIKEKLGFDIPSSLLADYWVQQVDMRRLYAWCLFETYQSYCNSFASEFPVTTSDEEFQAFLQECGFHTLDISPCADGRLAHVISYVLRLPYRTVRRKSYAGAMFDIEDSLDKWVETEMIRFREGGTVNSALPTRYLKAVVYHFSSRDPDNEGCAAHGSDAELAAQSGRERLKAFKQAVENTYCCGASIENLLIGLDTDTDVIRVHVPDENGGIDTDSYIDAREVYFATQTMQKELAQQWIIDLVEGANPSMHEGMVKLIACLLTNNISQIDYVQTFYGGCYEDIGHAERFIGAGIGFEEVQLRNLTYFAYLNTVEEAANDIDVGIKIFTKLNILRGLPVPVIVRYDYHGNVPGARERAVEHCNRVSGALRSRYPELHEKGLLHTLMVIKDVNTPNSIELLDCSISTQATQEAH
jgi:carboxysome shell carbonic anhydrase